MPNKYLINLFGIPTTKRRGMSYMDPITLDLLYWSLGQMVMSGRLMSDIWMSCVESIVSFAYRFRTEILT